jgi:hypothetical protein
MPSVTVSGTNAPFVAEHRQLHASWFLQVKLSGSLGVPTTISIGESKRPIESPPAAALETLRRHGMYSSQEQDDIMHQALLGIDSSSADLLISSHARETLCSFSTMHYGQSPNIRFATLTSVAGPMQK